MDNNLHALARRQHGNITRKQLLKLGVGRETIVSWLRRGFLHPVFRGVYAVGRPPTAGLERAAAAVLACGDYAALSHASAMTLWGFWREWETPIEVSVLRDRRPSGIHVHHPSTLHWRDLKRHRGIRATSAARTFLDMAVRLEDRLTRTVNRAYHTPYLTESQLADVLARNPTHPSTKLLLPFVHMQGRLTRSELEDSFLRFCKQHDLPTPLTNVLVGGYLVDAYFPRQRLIVEIDSHEFHSTRIDFENDRNRDADHLSDGIPTVRITHERITAAPDKEAARLRKILASRG